MASNMKIILVLLLALTACETVQYTSVEKTALVLEKGSKKVDKVTISQRDSEAFKFDLSTKNLKILALAKFGQYENVDMKTVEDLALRINASNVFITETISCSPRNVFGEFTGCFKTTHFFFVE